MHDADFVRTVSEEAPIESEELAGEVADAVLETLGERITDGAAEELARQLSDDHARTLTDVPGEAEPFGFEEFERRVRDRAGIGADEVRPYARGVAAALEAAAGDDLGPAREQLPPVFDVVFEPGGANTAADFFDRVREHGGLDAAAAEAATVAVLRTLGERLSAGEAADLAEHLPDPLSAELRDAADGTATTYTVDEFVRRVSQREGVERDEAREHAEAVGTIVAETASDRELTAAKQQLPDPFDAIFDHPNDGHQT